MTRLLRALFELQGDAIQAIAEARWFGTVIEDVTEVRAAARANNFVAFHSQAGVVRGGNERRDEWLRETGPTGARLKFGVAGKQRRVAADTAEHAAPMFARERRSAGAFSPFLTSNRILLRS